MNHSPNNSAAEFLFQGPARVENPRLQTAAIVVKETCCARIQMVKPPPNPMQSGNRLDPGKDHLSSGANLGEENLHLLKSLALFWAVVLQGKLGGQSDKLDKSLAAPRLNWRHSAKQAIEVPMTVGKGLTFRG